MAFIIAFPFLLALKPRLIFTVIYCSLYTFKFYFFKILRYISLDTLSNNIHFINNIFPVVSTIYLNKMLKGIVGLALFTIFYKNIYIMLLCVTLLSGNLFTEISDIGIFIFLKK